MAMRIIFGSCIVAVLSYLAYQELTFVTVEFSLKMDIPAKRSELFELLLDNPEFYLKVHPLCTAVENVIKWQDDDGCKTVKFDIQDTIVFFGFYESSITYQVTAKATQENAVIQNTANLMGGMFQVKQRWLLSDSEDGTLLEDHSTHTAPLVLARFSRDKGTVAHVHLLNNIRQYFIDHPMNQ